MIITDAEHWQFMVELALRAGFGVEDIAIKLGCSADDVRREVEIYRQEGRIGEIVRGK